MPPATEPAQPGRRRVLMPVLLATAMALAPRPASPAADPSAGVGAQQAQSASTAAVLPAGTPVVLELVSPLSSATAEPGQEVAFRVHADVSSADTVVIPAGTRGRGRITQVQKAANGGRQGELLLTAHALDLDGVTIPLRATLGRSGASHGAQAMAISWLSPVAVVLIRGSDIVLPAGALLEGRLAESFPAGVGPVPPAIGRQLRPELQALLGDLPADRATVVFYRVMGGFPMDVKLRDGERMIGIIDRGQFLVTYVSPGPHRFWANPKDPVTLDVEAGELYFVETSLNKTLAGMRYELSPSDESGFQAASGTLSPVPAKRRF